MALPRLRPRTARAEGEPSEIWKHFAIAGAVLIAIAFVMITFFPSKNSGSAASATTAITSAAVSSDDIATWYTGTHAVRQRVANDVASVRAFLDAQDGNALRPACSLLADDITEARALTPGPDAATQALFDAGLTGYSDGVTACGNLFDGTKVAVGELQQKVRAGLDTGDQQWAALATRLSLPSASAVPDAAQTASRPPATAAATTATAAPRTTAPATRKPTSKPTTPTPQPTVKPTVTTPPPATTTTPPPATTAPPTTSPATAGEQPSEGSGGGLAAMFS